MSIATWCNEYFPLPLQDYAYGEEPLQCLLKYIGLRKENLFKHGIILENGKLQDTIIEQSSLKTIEQSLLKADTCSLCWQYYNSMKENPCEDCPLFLQEIESCDDPNSLYKKAKLHNNIEPMITALTKIIAKEYHWPQAEVEERTLNYAKENWYPPPFF